jgi:hypothetical protein
MSTISAIMAIMFVALSVSSQVGHTHPEFQKITNITPASIEYHKEIGSIVLYDSITNKTDTLVLFQKIK